MRCCGRNVSDAITTLAAILLAFVATSALLVGLVNLLLAAPKSLGISL